MHISFLARTLVLSITLVFMHSQTTAADIRRVSETVVINGNINAGDADKFTAFAQGASAVEIGNSAGGDEQDIFTIAQFISSNQLVVRLKGACAGYCASMLFLAAKTREIDNGGVLIFSPTALDLRTFVWEEEMKFNAWQQDSFLEEKLQAEHQVLLKQKYERRAIYEKSGLSLIAIEQIGRLFRPDEKSFRLFTRTSRTGGGVEYNPTLARLSNCVAWVPDTPALMEIGISIANDYVSPAPAVIAQQLHLQKGQQFYIGSIMNEAAIQKTCVINNRDKQ
jgi:hypothetical protein